jgi:nucleoside-diphosphate-sugar epimerase
VLGPPHEWQSADVTNAAQVLDACAGMDAIVDCTVVRQEPAGAFRVNALGPYNVMRAAVAHGIRRVVHTGPFQVGRHGGAGLDWETLVVDDAPPRPGGKLDAYLHSKLLGQEVCRIFAEAHGLEVPALLFYRMIDPAPGLSLAHAPFIVSWADAARAVRAALETPALPSPFERFHINADLPHGIFPNDKAKRLLGWQPRDDLRSFWQAGPAGLDESLPNAAE